MRPRCKAAGAAATVGAYTSDALAAGAYSQFDVLGDAQGPFEIELAAKASTDGAMGPFTAVTKGANWATFTRPATNSFEYSTVATTYASAGGATTTLTIVGVIGEANTKIRPNQKVRKGWKCSTHWAQTYLSETF